MPSLDLQAYLEDDKLVLQGVCSTKHPNGKSYINPSPSARTVLLLKQIMQSMDPVNRREVSAADIAAFAALTTDEDGQPVDIAEKVMGATRREMVDDGVSGDRLERIESVVLTYYAFGSEVARAVVAGPGESPARPNRTARRAASRQAGSKSSRASGATAGRSRARTSTSGSSAKKATKKTA